jgi:ABC-2 type transport system ATP-binding protein
MLRLIIETEDLTKTYGSLLAVDKLNLKVEAETVHGFLGPNGAGKTTVIKMLLGLLKPDSGRIRILGSDAVGDKPEIRQRLGYLPELPKFPKHLTGWELLDIYGKMFGMSKKQRLEQLPKLFGLVGLKGRAKDALGKYSKGMQQRLGIAQALLGSPELVILDEPSLGLDPVGIMEVRDLMKDIARGGVTVFLSSHLLFEVQEVCSHATIIHKGVTLASDRLEKISAMFSGPSRLLVEVVEVKDALVKGVKNLPFVKEVLVEEKVLAIELETAEDVRSKVSQMITSSGGIIVSMQTEGQSLEKAFVNLVTEEA